MKVKAFGDTAMTDVDLPLYLQQSRETSVAYAAFKIYLELGDERSLPQVAGKCRKNVSLINRWSRTWNWVNRVIAWKRFQQRELDKATRKVAEAKAHEWAQREQTLRESEWQMAEQLMEKVNQMLKMPIVRQSKTTEEVSADGKTIIQHTTIVEPVKFDFGTAAGLVAQVSKLRRLATGIETDKTETVLPAGAMAGSRVVVMMPDNGRRQQAAPVKAGQNNPSKAASMPASGAFKPKKAQTHPPKG